MSTFYNPNTPAVKPGAPRDLNLYKLFADTLLAGGIPRPPRDQSGHADNPQDHSARVLFDRNVASFRGLVDLYVDEQLTKSAGEVYPRITASAVGALLSRVERDVARINEMLREQAGGLTNLIETFCLDLKPPQIPDLVGLLRGAREALRLSDSQEVVAGQIPVASLHLAANFEDLEERTKGALDLIKRVNKRSQELYKAGLAQLSPHKEIRLMIQRAESKVKQFEDRKSEALPRARRQLEAQIKALSELQSEDSIQAELTTQTKALADEMAQAYTLITNAFAVRELSNTELGEFYTKRCLSGFEVALSNRADLDPVNKRLDFALDILHRELLQRDGSGETPDAAETRLGALQDLIVRSELGEVSALWALDQEARDTLELISLIIIVSTPEDMELADFTDALWKHWLGRARTNSDCRAISKVIEGCFESLATQFRRDTPPTPSLAGTSRM